MVCATTTRPLVFLRLGTGVGGRQHSGLAIHRLSMLTWADLRGMVSLRFLTAAQSNRTGGRVRGMDICSLPRKGSHSPGLNNSLS